MRSFAVILICDFFIDRIQGLKDVKITVENFRQMYERASSANIFKKELSSVLFPEVPRITATHPVIQVSVGGDATLECQATGVPPPLVHWFKGKLRSTATQPPLSTKRRCQEVKLR